jgi:hypothetical protein
VTCPPLEIIETLLVECLGSKTTLSAGIMQSGGLEEMQPLRYLTTRPLASEKRCFKTYLIDG